MKVALVVIFGSFALILGMLKLSDYLEHVSASIEAETRALEAKNEAHKAKTLQPIPLSAHVLTLSAPSDPEEFEPILHPEQVSALNLKQKPAGFPVFDNEVGSWNDTYPAEAFEPIVQHSMRTLTWKDETYVLIELGPAVVLSALAEANLSPMQRAHALASAKAFLNVEGRRSYAFAASKGYHFHRLPYIEADGRKAPLTYISPSVAQDVYDPSKVFLLAFANPACSYQVTAIDVVINPEQPQAPGTAQLLASNPQVRVTVSLHYPVLRFRFIQPGPSPGDSWLQALNLKRFVPEPSQEDPPPPPQPQATFRSQPGGGPSTFDILSFAVSVVGLFMG